MGHYGTITCGDSTMAHCHELTYISNWCLPSFVISSSCTVLLLLCFLVNIYNSMHNSTGRLRRKVTFAIASFKKGSGLVFEGGSAHTVNWEIFHYMKFLLENFSC